MGEFTRGPMDIGYSQTPHGLWTLIEVSTGARVLLGWLHSHTDTYLASVTVNMARRTLNTSSIASWLRELEAAGFVTVTRGANGRAVQINLEVPPWVELHQRRRHRAETGPPPPSRDRPANQAETGPVTGPKPARVVNQVGNQEGNQTPPTPQGGMESVAWFDIFWDEYGRLGPRKKALECWKKAIDKDTPENIISGLRAWLAYWQHPDAAKQKWPQGWLNEERWRDEPPRLRPAAIRLSGAEAAIAEHRGKGLG